MPPRLPGSFLCRNALYLPPTSGLSQLEVMFYGLSCTFLGQVSFQQNEAEKAASQGGSRKRGVFLEGFCWKCKHNSQKSFSFARIWEFLWSILCFPGEKPAKLRKKKTPLFHEPRRESAFSDLVCRNDPFRNFHGRSGTFAERSRVEMLLLEKCQEQESPKVVRRGCRIPSDLVARIARPVSLAIWHRGCSHRKPNRSESPNRKHFASLDL